MDSGKKCKNIAPVLPALCPPSKKKQFHWWRPAHLIRFQWFCVYIYVFTCTCERVHVCACVYGYVSAFLCVRVWTQTHTYDAFFLRHPRIIEKFILWEFWHAPLWSVHFVVCFRSNCLFASLSVGLEMCSRAYVCMIVYMYTCIVIFFAFWYFWYACI